MSSDRHAVSLVPRRHDAFGALPTFTAPGPSGKGGRVSFDHTQFVSVGVGLHVDGELLQTADLVTPAVDDPLASKRKEVAARPPYAGRLRQGRGCTSSPDQVDIDAEG